MNRTRTRIQPQSPGLFESFEWEWDKSTTPWSISTTPSHLDTDPAIRQLFFGFNFPWSDFPVESHVMVDTVSGDGRFHTCYHEAQTNVFSLPVVRHRAVFTGATNAYARGINKSVLATALGSLDLSVIPWQALANKAAAHMWPRLNKDTSLVNFVLELKDIKRSNPLPSVRRVFHRHLALRHLRDPVTRRQFSKELVTRLTGAHLNAEFGIKPFVKDLVQMFDELSTLSARVQAIRTNSSRRLTAHYRQRLDDVFGQAFDVAWHGGEVTPLAGWQGGIKNDTNVLSGTRRSIVPQAWGRWVRPPVYHATMRYSYTVPSMGKVEEEIATRLDSLGVRLDPAIVWNAIPFSFLVDWVVDVSSWLRSFARDNFPIQVSLHEFCHSVTYRREAQVLVGFEDDSGEVFDFPTTSGNRYGTNGPVYGHRPGVLELPVWRGTRSYYNRILGLPDIHAITTNGPNLRKAALGGSLLLQRVNSFNNRRYLRRK